MTADVPVRAASVVFIYGPPAVGKLTVARELCALTGYRLFDNHMSIDWAHAIFPAGSLWGITDEPFGRLRDRFRLAVFEEAARALVGVVTTYVYAAGADDAYVQRMFDAVEANGGRICLVQLSCDPAVHAARVTSPGRREAGKLATSDGLREVMHAYDLTASIPGRESLRLETTALPAAEVARRVVEHFGLAGAPR